MAEKLNIEEFNSLVDKTQSYFRKLSGNLCVGEAYMNVLRVIKPAIYAEVTGMDGIDPFCDSKNLPNFF